MLKTAMKYYDEGYSPFPAYSPKMLKNGQKPKWYDAQKEKLLSQNANSGNPLSEQEVILELDIMVCKTPIINLSRYRNKRPTRENVRKWFEKWPDANIGLLTGKVHGLYVVDIVEQDFIDFIKPAGSFLTTISKTKNGRHFYFTCTEGYLEGNPVIKPTQTIYGNGKYVVVPPSVHGTGQKYKWVTNKYLIGGPIAGCDPWMFNFYNSYIFNKYGLSSKTA